MRGQTLHQFLKIHRGKQTHLDKPALTDELILEWADAYKVRTGKWPGINSGEVTDAAGETWSGLNQSLHKGLRGFPGGSSLAILLGHARGVPNPKSMSPLTENKIIRWARNHYKINGVWPTVASGDIQDRPGENWRSIDRCLRRGLRKLAGGSSLPILLKIRLDLPLWRKRRPLTEAQIWTWAKSQFRKTGEWPTPQSGSVLVEPTERWRNIDLALTLGRRGLPGGSSLKDFIAIHREKT